MIWMNTIKHFLQMVSKCRWPWKEQECKYKPQQIQLVNCKLLNSNLAMMKWMCHLHSIPISICIMIQFYRQFKVVLMWKCKRLLLRILQVIAGRSYWTPCINKEEIWKIFSQTSDQSAKFNTFCWSHEAKRTKIRWSIVFFTWTILTTTQEDLLVQQPLAHT